MSKSSWVILTTSITLIASVIGIFRCIDERLLNDDQRYDSDPEPRAGSQNIPTKNNPVGTGSRVIDGAPDTGTVHEDGSQETVCVTFDMNPQTDQRYVRYAILDTQGNTIINNPASNKRVCLPPGHYGYAFIDANGSWFERRLSGFTIREER